MKNCKILLFSADSNVMMRSKICQTNIFHSCFVYWLPIFFLIFVKYFKKKKTKQVGNFEENEEIELNES